MKLSETRFLFLDCQTTGMRPPFAHLLELAWAVGSAEDSETRIESKLIKLPDGEKVPSKIREITGISDEDLIAADPIEDVFRGLEGLCDRPPVAVIHYAQFEKAWLLDLYARFGIPVIPFEILCSHEIAKRLFPALPSRNIRGLAGFFGAPHLEAKRAGDHVAATLTIWKGIVQELAGRGIHTLDELRGWQSSTRSVKARKYEYRIDRLKRLALPDRPGVYKMKSKSGRILYVGKATSLRDRVNSYFRGKKGRDPRKLEMLTQTWDLEFTECQSALEAALLETDEIKRLDPPYNVSLKTGRRLMVFYSRDFESVSEQCDQKHPLGPFPPVSSVEQARILSASLRDGAFRQIFYDEISVEILEQGFALFCAEYGLDPAGFRSTRRFLAFGLNLYRNLRRDQDSEGEVVAEDGAENEDPAAEAEREPTPEEVAAKFTRLAARSGARYLRARQLTQLLNSRIEFEANGEKRVLQFRGGRSDAESAIDTASWQGLDIGDYDRMSVLMTELAKVPHKIERPDRSY